MKIAVWHDDRLPQQIIDFASTLTPEKDLRYNDGVETGATFINGNYIKYVLADGHCGKHKDWDEVSFLWVARNDTKSWVGVQGIRAIKDQPIGTLILLNIESIHYLQQQNGLKGLLGTWFAVLIDSFPEWPEENEVNECLKEFLSDFQGRKNEELRNW